VLLPGRADRTVSPAQIAAQGGLSCERTAAMMEAFGLPRPPADDPSFTPEEARALIELGRLEELWPDVVRLQVGRAYGAMLAGIARAEVQAFQTHTERELRGRGGDDAAQVRAVQATFERLLPLADPLLLGVHRRWLEHELSQRAVRAAEQQLPAGELPGAVDVTFLFCDLKDFTAYAEVNGDAAAMSAIESFLDVVARERGDDGELVKSLGDGAMLAYKDPAEAVRAGLRVIRAMRELAAPGVHASVHRGVAIARSGDYFGSAVNLASRLLALAGRDELVASAGVVDDCRGDAFPWASIGETELRGVTNPVMVSRLSSPRRS
jgi:adenylate cyclase